MLSCSPLFYTLLLAPERPSPSRRAHWADEVDRAVGRHANMMLAIEHTPPTPGAGISLRRAEYLDALDPSASLFLASDISLRGALPARSNSTSPSRFNERPS